MERTTLALAASTGILAMGIVGLAVTNWRLANRISALEMVAAQQLVKSGATASSANTSAQDIEAIEQAVATWREAQSGEGAMTPDEASALIEQTLEEVLDRKAEERKTREVDEYMKWAEESMRVDVEDLGKEFGLTEDQVNRTVETLVQGMYEGYELKRDLKEGAITMREAKEEGDVIKDEYAEALTEILGEEAYEELGRKFYGEAGWDAKR